VPGAGCAYGGWVYPAGSSFPSTDGCNTCGCTSGGDVACTKKACPPGSECRFPSVFTGGYDGGFVRYSESSTLSPEADHALTRTYRDGTPALRCHRALACSDPHALGVKALMEAIRHPDVVAALQRGGTPLYGTDPRPSDGALWVFAGADGNGFQLGEGAIPAGLTQLRERVQQLEVETRATPACAALRP
jgi:hypothetical protein